MEPVEDMKTIEKIEEDTSKKKLNILMKHLFAGYIRFMGGKNISSCRKLRNSLCHVYDNSTFQKQNYIIGGHEKCIDDVLHEDGIDDIILDIPKDILEDTIHIACLYYLTHLISFNKELFYTCINKESKEYTLINDRWCKICEKMRLEYGEIKINDISPPIWSYSWILYSEEMNNIFIDLDKLKISKKHRHYTDDIKDFHEISRHLLIKMSCDSLDDELNKIYTLIEMYGDEIVELLFSITDDIPDETYRTIYEKDFKEIKDYVKECISKMKKKKKITYHTYIIKQLNIIMTKAKSYVDLSTKKFANKSMYSKLGCSGESKKISWR
jgi:hypothetical protein